MRPCVQNKNSKEVRFYDIDKRKTFYDERTDIFFWENVKAIILWFDKKKSYGSKGTKGQKYPFLYYSQKFECNALFYKLIHNCISSQMVKKASINQYIVLCSS